MWCRATWSSGPSSGAGAQVWAPYGGGACDAPVSALVICAILTSLNGCECATTTSISPLPPGQTVSESSHEQQGRSAAGITGRPVMPREGPAVDLVPTAAELDQRERILAAPRPGAGPPLREATPGAASGGPRPLRVVPPATDPTW